MKPQKLLTKNTKYILQRSVGLIILLIVISRIDPGEFLEIIEHTKLSNLLVAAVLFIPSLLLRSLRLSVIMNTQGSGLRLTDYIKIYAYSIFIGSITPGRLGEFIKAVYFEKKGTPFSASIYGTLLDRLFDVLGISIIGSTVFFTFSAIGAQIDSKIIVIYLIIVSLISLAIFKSSLVGTVINYLIRSAKKPSSKNLNNNISVRQPDFKPLALSFILTALALICNFSSIYYLAKSIGLGIPYIDILGISALVSLVSMIPISFLGLGTRDILLIQILALYGIDKVGSVAFSTLIFFLLITNALICAFSLLTDVGNLKWK
ncbi:MAG: flippase-like domain-containing protein [Candidatus Dadabacteria bacterium]|nr:flippase-like domain-containing protein [Candidatus Dadabacteria bacterium]NIS08035.1 flippase-like domain-containing protein [Candidatus Dadabacteria bacterium]NIV40858.1 flippase-like domain-containing protein [Candidatus Dadabacteria bacterium]NIY21613.1 flippase-like domain-containing protein [Candidatus Dadabacteria bacterium]